MDKIVAAFRTKDAAAESLLSTVPFQSRVSDVLAQCKAADFFRFFLSQKPLLLFYSESLIDLRCGQREEHSNEQNCMRYNREKTHLEEHSRNGSDDSVSLQDS